MSDGCAQIFFFTYSNPLFFALLSTCPLTQFYYLQVKLQVLQEEEEEEEKEIGGRGGKTVGATTAGPGGRKSKRKRKSDKLFGHIVRHRFLDVMLVI